jgi:hypothetical protein
MATATVDSVEIATQAIEAVGTIVSAYASVKMLEVAKDNYELWQDQRDYYFDTFYKGVEVPLAAYVFGIPRRELDYSAQTGTIHDSNTGPFGGAAGDIGGWWDRHAKMYNATRDAEITELDPDFARLQSDWGNYLFRYEEHAVDIFNDIRWDRRLSIHNVGIKQGTAISAALSTAFNKYEDAINSAGDQFATLANGAASYAGYRRGMADTADDFTQYGYRKNEPAKPVVKDWVGPR